MNANLPATIPPDAIEDLEFARKATSEASQALHQTAALGSIAVDLLDHCDDLYDLIEAQRIAFEDVLLMFAKNGYTPAAKALVTMRELQRKARAMEPQQ
jgi:hypothetical protein